MMKRLGILHIKDFEEWIYYPSEVMYDARLKNHGVMSLVYGEINNE